MLDILIKAVERNAQNQGGNSKWKARVSLSKRYRLRSVKPNSTKEETVTATLQRNYPPNSTAPISKKNIT
jgi:hypothetical protein